MGATVLSALPAAVAIAVLLVAHPLSRLAAVSLIWRLAYVKAEGKAKPLAQHMSSSEFLIAALTVAVPIAALVWLGAMPWYAMLAAMLAAAVVTIWFARLLVRRIGGYTGDCLGAVQQAAEVSIYLAVLALTAPA